MPNFTPNRDDFLGQMIIPVRPGQQVQTTFVTPYRMGGLGSLGAPAAEWTRASLGMGSLGDILTGPQRCPSLWPIPMYIGNEWKCMDTRGQVVSALGPYNVETSPGAVPTGAGHNYVPAPPVAPPTGSLPSWLPWALGIGAALLLGATVFMRPHRRRNPKLSRSRAFAEGAYFEKRGAGRRLARGMGWSKGKKRRGVKLVRKLVRRSVRRKRGYHDIYDSSARKRYRR
jgi:hypothetical protein